MDGYNQYPLNHCYDQRGMIYPPQHGDVSYDDWRNFDHHYQMQQVPSYYQDWRNEEASPPPPQGYYPPHPHQYPHPQHPYPPYPYPPPPPEEQYRPPPPPPIEEPHFEFHEASEGNWYDNERSFEYGHQMQQVPSHYQYHDWGKMEASPFLIEAFKNYMGEDEFQRALDELRNDNKVGFEYDYQMQQASSHYQEWERNEYWPPSNEGRTTTEELIAHMMERIDANDKRMEERENNLKSLLNGMEQMNSTIEALVIAMKEKEDPIEDEDEKGYPLEDMSTRMSLIVIEEDDREECPSMDTSKKEQEDLEASEDEVKRKMSISKPLNSSIHSFFDIDTSVDFILPLDHFDSKKEVERSLGILEEKGKQWKERMEKEQEESSLMKVWKKHLDDWSSIHKSLLGFEAQRLKYNGKEDRYPWPFR